MISIVRVIDSAFYRFDELVYSFVLQYQMAHRLVPVHVPVVGFTLLTLHYVLYTVCVSEWVINSKTMDFLSVVLS